MMGKEGQGCYIYTRVSTEMQVDGYSLAAQKEKLQKYADYQEMPILGRYCDEGKSGKSIEGRTEFTRMLEDIKSKRDRVSYVLVFKLSRFGRNTADVLNSLQLIQDYGVNLICVEDGIDSSKEVGKLMITVLSAVAEMERENILVQTMEGRKQKAREGKWNGGFAPYGYKLVNGQLYIEEDEAETIRLMFDLYIKTNKGVHGVTKHLVSQGIKKKAKGFGYLEQFTQTFVRNVLDNPIYYGKIAFGRRRTEKVEGTRNDYHMVKSDDYILSDGLHEAIITEEIWMAAQAKRKETGGMKERIHNIGRRHLLSSIVKCPICGAGLYGNVNRKLNSDRSVYSEYHYYACKHRQKVSGHNCTYRKQWREELINDAVVEIIKSLVNNEKFAELIRSKIGSGVDTTEIDNQIANYEKQRQQVICSKSNLEDRIDRLPIDDKHYDRKLQDYEHRLDGLYEELEYVETLLEEAKRRKKNIEMHQISIDNIYKYLLHFDKLYDKFNDDEKREFLASFVSEVHLFEERQKSGQLIKRIKFKFPVFYNGQDIEGISWDNNGHVETVVSLSLKKDTHKIEVAMQPSDESNYMPKEKVTYPKIKQYIKDKYNVNVHTSYIAQVKRMCGLDMGENYNKSKKENPDVKQCPQEKIEYIKEALEYYRLL